MNDKNKSYKQLYNDLVGRATGIVLGCTVLSALLAAAIITDSHVEMWLSAWVTFLVCIMVFRLFDTVSELGRRRDNVQEAEHERQP